MDASPSFMSCRHCSALVRGSQMFAHDQWHDALADEVIKARGPATKMAPSPELPIDLLREWYQWWFTARDSPAKMPNALHIRTSLALGYIGVPSP